MEAERESGYSEDVCLPFGHFVLELAALGAFGSQSFCSWDKWPSIFIVSLASLCRFIIFVTLLKFEFKHLE